LAVASAGFLAPLAAFAQATCKVNGTEVPCEALGQTFQTLNVLAIAVPIIFVLVALFAFVFWIWMIVDAAKREFPDKAIWILVIVLTHFVGALIYYFAVKKKDSCPPSETVAPTRI
jgi:amino acid transporter